MKKAWIGVVVLLVVLIGARIAITLTTKQDDRELIRQALNQSIQDGKNGKPGAIIDLLGKKLTVNSESQSGNLSQLSDFIKRSHPDIVFDHVDPVVNGDRAEVSSPATLTFSLLGQHQSYPLDNVVLIFEKEATTQWLVIPAVKWKLEQVDVPNLSTSGL